MQNHDLIVLGASAGGLDALTAICRGLPADLPAALLVVQHVSPTSRSAMAEILGRAGKLPSAQATDGARIRPGTILVAPPDQHLLVAREGDRVLLRRGPQENRTRPAIDPLFRSAAVARGPRVVGVVLSGMLDDGTAGLVAVKACGGISVVQDPADAAWPDMPRNALLGDSPDHCLPAAALPALLDRLARTSAGPSAAVPSWLLTETRIAEQEMAGMANSPGSVGLPSRMSCPACGGVLNEIEDEARPRFRCQIGHAFGPDSLAMAQQESLEEALSVAIRTHHDRKLLFRRMQEQAAMRGMTHATRRWQAAAAEADRAAGLIGRAMATLRGATKDEA
ncbi:chemotaxis protein CheB [Falsiroseomonas selenitidurans]|uniref:protein-glutamate methylesterase n=1 Tax=Falsiroseomonas selenitidurans TaxID=2716335 RepID=A0ABX1E8X4_9PROT|nr:chemotaxis protein CheB [Falsiroseomonas selenitidurans]NKC32258.1 chemotaxis protein CheB [Falsiroseomonas selenitidurans]